jgi:hypothetical protein
MTIDSLESLRMVARGLPREGSEGLLQIPGLLDTQAAWLYQLGLVQLEAGAPQDAAAFFRAALEVSPKLTLKPLLDYYLEQIGEQAAAAPAPVGADGPVAPTVVPAGAAPAAGELPAQPFSSGP